MTELGITAESKTSIVLLGTQTSDSTLSKFTTELLLRFAIAIDFVGFTFASWIFSILIKLLPEQVLSIGIWSDKCFCKN